jgi:photosystem II stability/assembly factor-like uncharacterized protein
MGSVGGTSPMARQSFRPRGADGDSTVMPGAFAMAGGKGAFVVGGYMTMTASPDFGKSFSTFSLRTFRDDPRTRQLVTHHVEPVYCGDATGRFLAIGNDRSKENPPFGNLFASDDLGKTWKWFEPTHLNQHCDGYSGFATNGKLVLIADKAGENVFRSPDAGETWEGPFPTTGTLISIGRRRFNILRSTDGGESWSEVHSFEPETEHVHGVQGLRDIVSGFTTSRASD